MQTKLILSLVKIGAEIFQDERKDRFLRKQKKLEDKFNEEMAKHSNDRDDLLLNQLLYDSVELAELVIVERSKH